MSEFSFVILKAFTYYSYNDTKTQTVTLGFMKMQPPTMKHHYLFVPDGSTSGRTPNTDPGWAYTMGSDSGRLQNYVAQDPTGACISCQSYQYDTGLL